nr:hypothetical protein [Streptomyces sp. SCL15-6]
MIEQAMQVQGHGHRARQGSGRRIRSQGRAGQHRLPGFDRSSFYDSPANFGGQIAAAFGMGIPTLLDQAPSALGITIDRFVEPAEITSAAVFLLTRRRGQRWHAQDRVSLSRRSGRRSRLAPGAPVTRPLSLTITAHRPWVYH